jgi:archaellum component FlaC
LLEAIGQLLAPIHDDISEIKERVTKIEIHQENVTDKNIQLLIEGQKGMNEQFQKLDQVAEDVEEIKIKVTALEAVTRDNTSQIKDICAVK